MTTYTDPLEPEKESLRRLAQAMKELASAPDLLQQVREFAGEVTLSANGFYAAAFSEATIRLAVDLYAKPLAENMVKYLNAYRDAAPELSAEERRELTAGFILSDEEFLLASGGPRYQDLSDEDRAQYHIQQAYLFCGVGIRVCLLEALDIQGPQAQALAAEGLFPYDMTSCLESIGIAFVHQYMGRAASIVLGDAIGSPTSTDAIQEQRTSFVNNIAMSMPSSPATGDAAPKLN